jgi:hypothetical protein
MNPNVVIFNHDRLDDGIMIDGVSMDDLKYLLFIIDGQIQIFESPNAYIESLLNVHPDSLENIREIVRSNHQRCLKIKAAILEAFPQLI